MACLPPEATDEPIRRSTDPNIILVHVGGMEPGLMGEPDKIKHY
jgi:hypothetical protein